MWDETFLMQKYDKIFTESENNEKINSKNSRVIREIEKWDRKFKMIILKIKLMKNANLQKKEPLLKCKIFLASKYLFQEHFSRK